jgi:hypothetical protein
MAVPHTDPLPPLPGANDVVALSWLNGSPAAIGKSLSQFYYKPSNQIPSPFDPTTFVTTWLDFAAGFCYPINGHGTNFSAPLVIWRDSGALHRFQYGGWNIYPFNPAASLGAPTQSNAVIIKRTSDPSIIGRTYYPNPRVDYLDQYGYWDRTKVAGLLSLASLWITPFVYATITFDPCVYSVRTNQLVPITSAEVLYRPHGLRRRSEFGNPHWTPSVTNTSPPIPW